MDQAKLDALRRKYQDAKGGDIFDPAFAAIAATIFIDNKRRTWPFAGVPTFLGAPLLAASTAGGPEEFGDIDVALVGVPMDLGVTNRAGARLGPRAVRNVERIGPYEHVLRSRRPDAESRRCRRRAVGKRFCSSSAWPTSRPTSDRLHAADVIPLAVGGDHSVTYRY